jgi:ribosomal protein S18 acetylase RimI-like enzyme
MIRKAKKEDLNKIASLFKKGFSEKPYNEKWTDRNAKDKIEEYYKNGTILVNIENNSILGFIIFSELLWDNHIKLMIDEMVVDEAYRGKGIGTLLLKEAEKPAKKKGINNIELVSNINSNAFNLYKKLNYKETGLVVMEKILQ